MAFKPRRNLTKVLEEAEDEKQSPRNTNKKPMAPPSIKVSPSRIWENVGCLEGGLDNVEYDISSKLLIDIVKQDIKEVSKSDENSGDSDSDKSQSKSQSEKTEKEETKKPKNSKKNTGKEKETINPKDNEIKQPDVKISDSKQADKIPAVEIPKKEDVKVNPTEDKTKQSTMNKMKELVELSRRQEALKAQQKEEKITHEISNLDKDKKKNLLNKIEDALGELPSSSNSDENESDEYD